MLKKRVRGWQAERQKKKKKKEEGDFPLGPVVKTLGSQSAGGTGSVPG